MENSRQHSRYSTAAAHECDELSESAPPGARRSVCLQSIALENPQRFFLLFSLNMAPKTGTRMRLFLCSVWASGDFCDFVSLLLTHLPPILEHYGGGAAREEPERWVGKREWAWDYVSRQVRAGLADEDATWVFLESANSELRQVCEATAPWRLSDPAPRLPGRGASQPPET
jgi:hypothetical protein